MSSDRINRAVEHGPVHWLHLSKRFFGSWSSAQPPVEDREWALSWLLPGEAALWESMPVEDLRHTIRVARAYLAASPEATRAEMAAALLHDIGKVASGLGTMGRVAAKVIGPRSRRFKLYADHEPIGADMLRHAGSDPLTIEMIDGTVQDVSLLAKLLAADNS